MSRNALRRASLFVPLALAIPAGCTNTDVTAPKFRSNNPSFAQGVNGVWTVNTRSDPGDGVCDDTHCTLREAIAAAQFLDKIVFAGGLSGTISISTPLIVGKPLSIDGDRRITLDAHGDAPVMAVGNVIAAEPMPVTLDGLTFQNGASATHGGGIWTGAYTAVTVRNSIISASGAVNNGGGIYVSNLASFTLINSTVDGNTAGTQGGGIYNDGILVVTTSTISNNLASNGGGIYNAPARSASIVRSTISTNTPTATTLFPRGGGILSEGTLSLVSTTITRNAGYGLVVDESTATAANSILAGNTVGSCALLSSSSFLISLGHNLAETSFCGFVAAGDVTLPAGQAFTHVLEPDLKDNGGPTRTHALIARGLGVDAGRCPAETTDQRGFTRPVDDPTVPDVSDACDKGAYEAQGPQVAVADLMVSQTVDKNSVKQGELLTYSIRVQNLGPQAAPNVVVNSVLSSGVTFFEALVNKGSITAPPRGETGTVTWNLGDMANQANEVAEIKVTVLVRGKTTITNTATVTGNVADPNTANNSAAITVSVAPGSSGKKP